jgi:hypothetical protein
MYHTLPSGKKIKIDDTILKNLMSVLEVTKDEAIQIYLEDEGILDNEEQNSLDEQAKGVANVNDADRKKPKRKKANISDEKKALFNTILTNLTRCEGIEPENIKIVSENKKIEVNFNNLSFSIDIIQHRPPKH